MRTLRSGYDAVCGKKPDIARNNVDTFISIDINTFSQDVPGVRPRRTDLSYIQNLKEKESREECQGLLKIEKSIWDLDMLTDPEVPNTYAASER
jgi:hypothetical protein